MKNVKKSDRKPNQFILKMKPSLKPNKIKQFQNCNIPKVHLTKNLNQNWEIYNNKTRNCDKK